MIAEELEQVKHDKYRKKEIGRILTKLHPLDIVSQKKKLLRRREGRNLQTQL